MRYRELAPGPAAARFVKCYWLLEDHTPSEGLQRIVPDGRPELILNFADPFESQTAGEWQRQPQSFLVGQITGPLLLRARGPARVLGVRFHPHGASAFLGMPASELTDKIAVVEGVSTRLHRELQRLRDGEPLSGALGKLDGIFARTTNEQSDGLRCMAAAVRCLEKSGGEIRVAEIARNAGLGVRQLQRRFPRCSWHLAKTVFPHAAVSARLSGDRRRRFGLGRCCCAEWLL